MRFIAKKKCRYLKLPIGLLIRNCLIIMIRKMGLIIKIVDWDIYYISRGALFFVHYVRNLSIYKLFAVLLKTFLNDLSFASMVPFT